MAEASPRFRHDLRATAVEAEGVRYVDVQDDQSGVSFRFYDFEYDLALQLNGQPLDAVVAWGVTTYGLELTPQGIGEFTLRLAELGFLEAPPPPAPPAPSPRRPSDESQPVSQLVSRVVGQVSSRPRATPSQLFEQPSVMVDPAWPIASPTPPRLSAPSPSPPLVAPAARWVPDLDSVARPARVVREITAEPPVSETVMGFAAVKDIPEVRSRAPVEPDAAGTVMGFAAVTDKEIRGAEVTAARAALTPPPGVAERRQPPHPETVEMSAFEEEPRRRAKRFESGVRKSPISKDRSTAIVIVVAVLAVAAAGVGYYLWTQQQQQQAGPESQRVRVISPRPSAVYRWFDATGAVVAGEASALSFASAGRVTEVLPSGSRFAAGEIIARLQGSAAREADVNHLRSRIAYYQQMRDSMKAAGNPVELGQAERKIDEKTALLQEAQAELDRLVIRAAAPGEIAEAIAARGAMTAANAAAVRVKAVSWRGEFALDAKDAEAAGHLRFCRVEVVGLAPTASNARAHHGGESSAVDSGPASAVAAPRFVDCKLEGAAPAPGKKLEVGLPAGDGLSLGQPLRLARARFDGVFTVPRAAIVRVGDTDRVFVASPGGIAEPRAVTIADADSDEAAVSQGIDVGDQVIIDPPADLRDGSPIKIER